MGRLLENALRVVTKILDAIGGAALTLMMLLTVADVLMRAAGHPIVGTYEIVALSLALVIGFTIPKVSFDRGHVRVDLVLEKISKRNRDLLNIFTRLICIGLFILIGTTYSVSAMSSAPRVKFHRPSSSQPTPSPTAWRSAASLNALFLFWIS